MFFKTELERKKTINQENLMNFVAIVIVSAIVTVARSPSSVSTPSNY